MNKSKVSSLAFGLWLPLALSLTLITGFAFLAVQQNYRMSANDPQVQITHDAMQDLSQVPDLNQLAGAFNKIDISKVYNSFIVVYDEKGKPVAGNGYLNDQLPSLPANTLATTKNKGETRFTWQPNKSLRFAAVVTYFKGQQSGFIMAGRSLAETEKRIKMTGLAALIAWLAALLLSYLACQAAAKWMAKHFASHDHNQETAHQEHHTT
jgi:ABC-type nickel/cobalt efflux system permease component RcnA